MRCALCDIYVWFVFVLFVSRFLVWWVGRWDVVAGMLFFVLRELLFGRWRFDKDVGACDPSEFCCFFVLVYVCDAQIVVVA